MSEFRELIEDAAGKFDSGFTVSDIRKQIGWDNTVKIDTRIRYSLDRMGLAKEKRGYLFIYSHLSDPVTTGEKVMSEDKDIDFYKKFYDENRIRILQYESLKGHFQKMINDVLGDDYYNMAMDVYECDRICCEDITRKANRTALERLFNT